MKQMDIFGMMGEMLRTDPFYNTIGLKDNPLKEATKKAERQEDRVLEIFKATGIAMTPEDIERRYNDIFPPAPLTSFRRAITNLTKQGLLVKCEEMTEGKYGKPVHYWKIKA